MRGMKWSLSVLVILAVLAVSSTSWADRKHRHHRQQQGWYDRCDGPRAGHHPGWQQGRKTGWRGHHLPPGQAKKYRQHYRQAYNPYYGGRQYAAPMATDYIMVPVPATPW